MQLHVHGPNLAISEAIRRHASRRFGRALARTVDQINDVVVRVSDEGGPSGRAASDRRCVVVINMSSGEQITLHQAGRDLYDAIDALATRTKRVVRRWLSRRQDQRRH